MKTPFLLTSVVVLSALTTFARAQPPTASVTLIESNKVAAAFAKEIPMLENMIR